MNDTGTQQEYEMPLGARESDSFDGTYVNIRIGKIAQTDSKKIDDDWKPAKTTNRDGTVNNFFAKSYKDLTGFVTEIRWHKHTLKNGTILTGWNITIDTVTKGVFILGIGTKERPYQHTMNVLLNVDYDRPVMFNGFMGTNQKTQEPQKVLLLSQRLGPDKKPIWIQPVHETKWLSRMIIDKLKEGVELSQQEEKNVSRMNDGKFNKNYPYVVENPDGTWSWDVWNNFLYDQMNEVVIPAVKAAAEKRGVFEPVAEEQPASDADDFAPPMSGPASDDDIPF